MTYGRTKQTYSSIWHILKSDGRALCKSSLVIVEITEGGPGGQVCNRCKSIAPLSHNQRQILPMCVGGDGI